MKIIKAQRTKKEKTPARAKPTFAPLESPSTGSEVLEGDGTEDVSEIVGVDSTVDSVVVGTVSVLVGEVNVELSDEVSILSFSLLHRETKPKTGRAKKGNHTTCRARSIAVTAGSHGSHGTLGGLGSSGRRSVGGCRSSRRSSRRNLRRRVGRSLCNWFTQRREPDSFPSNRRSSGDIDDISNNVYPFVQMKAITPGVQVTMVRLHMLPNLKSRFAFVFLVDIKFSRFDARGRWIRQLTQTHKHTIVIDNLTKNISSWQLIELRRVGENERLEPKKRDSEQFADKGRTAKRAERREGRVGGVGVSGGKVSTSTEERKREGFSGRKEKETCERVDACANARLSHMHRNDNDTRGGVWEETGETEAAPTTARSLNSQLLLPFFFFFSKTVSGAFLLFALNLRLQLARIPGIKERRSASEI